MARKVNLDYRRGARLVMESLEQRWLLSVASPLAATAAVPDAPEGESSLAADNVNPQLTPFGSNEELNAWLRDQAVADYGQVFGQPTWNWLRELDGLPAAMPLAAQPTSALASTSQTNVQVPGVDEADLVESDGQYVYIIANGELAIVDARDPENLELAAQRPIDGYAVGEFLSGERLIVLSQDFNASAQPDMNAALVAPKQEFLRVTILDVSDRSDPAVVGELQMEGNYIDSRVSDGFVYLVTGNGSHLPFPAVVPASGKEAPPDGSNTVASSNLAPVAIDTTLYRYETEQEYFDRLGDDLSSWVLPNFEATDSNGALIDTGPLVTGAEVYRPISGDDRLVTVTSVDMNADMPVPIASASLVVDYASQVYVSPTSLYLATLDVNWQKPNDAATLIHQVALEPEGQIQPVAVGRVPGRVLDSFSIDEDGGYLRVGTTVGGSQEATSGVYVLQQQGGVLQVIGSVEGLAPGEQIRSARFLGDIAYLVTFRYVDPLFAIDLSDPTAPEVTGELKVSGFSQYLQRLGENRLLGIGQATTELGIPQGPQISLFDINNPESPQLLDQLEVDGGWWRYSDVQHSVGYYPDHQLLALPLNNFFSPLLFATDVVRPQVEHDLLLFRINDTPTESGDYLESLGKIVHTLPVARSVQMGEYLLSIGDDAVQVVRFDSPTNVVARLDLPRPGPVDPPAPDPDPLPPIDGPVVTIRLAVTDSQGQPVDVVNVGDTFEVRVFVEDLRAETRGVFAAYVDVAFDSQLASPDGDATFGDEFQNVRAGNSDTPGLLDELGATGGLTELGPGEQLLVTVPFVATASGELNFVPNPADDRPARDVLVYGWNAPVPETALQFVGSRVDVADASWQNARDPLDVNDDGSRTPSDALMIINDLNAAGPRALRGEPLVQVRTAAGALQGESEPSMVRALLDVNGDRYVTPRDALMVINQLNLGTSGEGESNMELARPAVTAPDISAVRRAAIDAAVSEWHDHRTAAAALLASRIIDSPSSDGTHDAALSDLNRDAAESLWATGAYSGE